MLFRIEAQTAQFLPFRLAFHFAIFSFASLIASSLLEASTCIVLLLFSLQQQVLHSIWVLAFSMFISALPVVRFDEPNLRLPGLRVNNYFQHK
jgi:hypothetical protein